MAQPTIHQAYDLALQHHRAGRLREAEQLYRQILFQQPTHADAMRHLGVIAFQAGRFDVAADLIRRAIALRPNDAEAHYNLGMALGQTGQLDEAIAAYRRAIAIRPDHANAFNNLGNVLREKGKLDESVAACRAAIALNRNFPEAFSNLGNALKEKGQTDEAIAAYRQAIALRPGYVEAHGNLGAALAAKGQFDEAIVACQAAIALNPNIPMLHSNLGDVLRKKGLAEESMAACRRAIALNPNYAEAHGNLGNALRDSGRLDEAIGAYRQAIVLKPNYGDAFNNLGVALIETGQLAESIATLRQAIALSPDYAAAHSNLGVALFSDRRFDEAIVALRRAIALKPESPEAQNNFGNALRDQGRLDEAIAAYRCALALKTSYSEALNNLGVALKDKGRLDEAIAAYRQALVIDPRFASAHSNLLCTIHYHPDFDSPAIAEELHRWNRQHAEPIRQARGATPNNHANDRGPDRRLRIGYVSSDFSAHASALFILPLLKNHDPRQVEVFCYAEVLRPDEFTGQMRRHVHHWRSTGGLSDEKLAGQIREDRIDILVDLKLHSAHNRLLVFARKPAPVQVTWLGYPGSTGLGEIDYRLSDPYLDPVRHSSPQAPGAEESVYSERTIRLPETFWCYDPLDGRDVFSNSLPALQAGAVTFGCLNNFCKINEGILAIWARVLGRVEGSRLLLLAPEGSHRQWALDQFRKQGINPERIEFFAQRPRRQYLEIYCRIDLGLDSFPCNGHTTSLDSFWMGVPVVTLVGKTAVSRAGFCQLSNLGLADLVAQTPEQFVRIAVELAHDLPRLAELRATLRRRMEASPLMDAPRFAWNIEAAYRRMWREWCETAPAKS